MGKAQKKRAIRHRHNPIRVPDSHLAPGLAAASASAASAKRDAILPIMQKLESSDATDRAWACAAVSNLINNDPSTRRLLQGKNVVGVLISRLSDSVDEVVVEAAGALRNLAIDGGFDICGEMHNKNILEPLKALVPKISSAFSSYLSTTTTPSGTQGEALSFVFQLAENAVTLFWCLSEISSKSLNAINNIGLVPFLMALLQHKSRFPARLVVAAAQCLYVLSDDNTPAVEVLFGDAAYISNLLSIAQSPNAEVVFGSAGSIEQVHLLKVLACGILKNASPLPKSSAAADVDLDRTVILPLFVPLLGLDLVAASNAAYTIASKPTDAIPPELRHAPKSDHQSADEKELERIETELLTVQLCLEILTGVCASLPDDELDFDAGLDGADEDADEEDDDIEDDEEDDEGEEEGDADMMDAEEVAPPAKSKSSKKKSAKKQQPLLSSSSPPPAALLSAIPTSPSTPKTLLHLLTPPLLALSRPTPTLSFPPPALPSVHPPTTSALGGIHVRALECLNNLFVGMGERELIDADGGSSLKDGDEEVVKGALGVWEQMWSAELLGAVGPPPVPSSSSGVPATTTSTVAAGGGGGLVALFGSGQERRAEMWSVAAGVLWGLARMSRGALVPNEEQVKILMALCDHAKDDKIQVQCIGTLGCLAQCQNPSAIDANLVISKYLLAILTSSTATSTTPSSALPTTGSSSTSSAPPFGVEPTLQAISSLVDIFADENSAYDANFRVAKVLKGMSDHVRGVQKLVKGIDSRKSKPGRGGGGKSGSTAAVVDGGGRALKAWAEGVLADLVGFVEYRRKLGR